MIKRVAKKKMPGLPWLPPGDYDTVEVVRNRGGMGDFLQILAACEELQKKSGVPVKLYGPESLVVLGEASKVSVEPFSSRNKSADGKAVVYLDFPCPSEGNEPDLNRLEIFHKALGVSPDTPSLKFNDNEIKAADVFCREKTGSSNPVILVYKTAERWKDYAYPKLLFDYLKEKNIPVILLDNTEKELPTPNTLGQSLRNICAIVNQARLVITPDTGWLHVAGFCHRPIFGLFGAQDPVYRQSIYKVPGVWEQGFCPHGEMPCWYKVCEGKANLQPCMKSSPQLVGDKILETLAAL